MSEMLGNQYFMARNYEEALKYLLPVYERNHSNNLVKRKLIICFFMTDKIFKAFDLFYELVLDDVEFIVKADPVFDDCPCQEIIRELNLENDSTSKQIEQLLLKGMIWLFCDPKQSLFFLEKAGEIEPHNAKISKTINTISKYLSHVRESI